MDGSNQTEKTQINTLNTFDDEPRKFSEHNMVIATWTSPVLHPSIGELVVTQNGNSYKKVPSKVISTSTCSEKE